ncbi:ABC transporter substrate-binding protein [Jiangella mangrovi]|uniref:Multiple sugar transport system substrate-binding protein n=1 Tax=Jiangella mangrovi TaxID=1524084 RepID=A0A7W9LPD6_9ACTN|nr:sugar ABC transporter substrate-binding protein [Jiangella mangrovi]MBB5791293.1 multiple sugar transport system substrate-binding protein [Jiangella mangrovi]
MRSTRGLSRRDFLGLAAGAAGAAVLGGGLAGCARGAQATPGTLRYWTLLDPNGDDPRGHAERQIFDLFEERTGLTVSEQVIPWQEIDPNLLTSVQAGIPPEVSRTNYYNFRRHAEAGSLEPLQAMADADFTNGELDDFVVSLEGEEGVEAFLIENIGNALFLRRDWLDAAGMSVPTTWDEFVEVGKAFVAAQPDVSGFLTFGSTTETGHVAYIFQPMILGRGGRILDDDGRAAFHEDAGVETFEFLRSLAYEHEIMPRDAATMAYSEQIDAFIAGRTGMIIEGSHRYARIVESLGAENVEVAVIPGPAADRPSPCSITGWAIAIPQGSPDVEGAWELIKHRTDPAMQEIWAEVAFGLPTRRSTLELPYFQRDEAAIMRWWLDYMETDGQLVTSPVDDTQLNEILAEALQEVLLDDGVGVRSVLAKAAERFDAVVR